LDIQYITKIFLDSQNFPLHILLNALQYDDDYKVPEIDVIKQQKIQTIKLPLL